MPSHESEVTSKASATALSGLGSIQLLLGNDDEAMKRYEASLEIFRGINDAPGIAQALNHIGTLEERFGEYDDALAHHQEALQLYRRMGNAGGAAGTLGSIGNVHGSMRDFEKALQHFEQGLTIAQAQAHVRSQEKWKHPVYWAAWTLWGLAN